jgi:hypothetical protein
MLVSQKINEISAEECFLAGISIWIWIFNVIFPLILCIFVMDFMLSMPLAL